jgi:PAS domain-containing protein
MFSDLEHEIEDKSKKEQQALRLSTLLRSIIDASPDLIYYRNEEGQFAGCNRVAEQMTGKTEQELIGLTPHQVYDEELASQVVASDHDVLENNLSITEELWLRFSDVSADTLKCVKYLFMAQIIPVLVYWPLGAISQSVSKQKKLSLKQVKTKLSLSPLLVMNYVRLLTVLWG